MNEIEKAVQEAMDSTPDHTDFIDAVKAILIIAAKTMDTKVYEIEHREDKD